MSVNGAPDADLDRRLTDWLHADAAPMAPESLETAMVEGVASTRQRPAWATTERWISTKSGARLSYVPRVVFVVLVISLLVLALAASLVFAGRLLDDTRGPLATVTYSTEGAIYARADGGVGAPVRLTDEGEFALHFAWSPDGKRFSYESWAARDGPVTLMVRDADGSNPVRVSEPFAPVRGVKPTGQAWSPDGTRIIYWARGTAGDEEAEPCEISGTACGQRIWSAMADGSEPARVIGDPELDARTPVWTPGGESIIFTGSRGGGTGWGIYLMDADGAGVQRIGDLASDSAFSLDFISISPDGTTAMVHLEEPQGGIHLVDLADGEAVRIDGVSTDAFEPSWSPDGSLVAFTDSLYDVTSGELLSLDTAIIVEDWSPDGRSLLGLAPDGTLVIVDVSEPMAPVATTVDGVTDVGPARWRPGS